jgi:hypothetical protein
MAVVVSTSSIHLEREVSLSPEPLLCFADRVSQLTVPSIPSFSSSQLEQQLEGRVVHKHIPSLEKQYSSQVLSLYLAERCSFGDYLTPNECYPADAQSHLTMRSPGLIVSTGGVRSLFDLSLADPEMCRGLVIRDINPKVKAYMDFEILLIRISTNHEKYQELANPEEPGDFTHRPLYLAKLEKIKKLLEESDMPEEMKQYYAHHLEEMAHIYFANQYPRYLDQCWKFTKSFQKVNYYEQREVFEKIQKYARAGKIIVTVGPIEDLQFLGETSIGVIDISNIPEYALLDFKAETTPEKILYTQVPRGHFSHLFTPLNCEEKEEIKNLLEMLTSRYQEPLPKILREIFYFLSTDRRWQGPLPPIYMCKGLLEALRKFKCMNCIEVPGYSLVEGSYIFNMRPWKGIFNTMDTVTLKQFVKDHLSYFVSVKAWLMREEFTAEVRQTLQETLEESS